MLSSALAIFNLAMLSITQIKQTSAACHGGVIDTGEFIRLFPIPVGFGPERAQNYCTPRLFNSPFAPSYSMYVVGQEDKAASKRRRASWVLPPNRYHSPL